MNDRYKSPPIMGKLRKTRYAKDYTPPSDPHPKGEFWFALDRAYVRLFGHPMRMTSRSIKDRYRKMPYEERMAIFGPRGLDEIATMIHDEAEELISRRLDRVLQIEEAFLDLTGRPMDGMEKRMVERMLEDEPNVSSEEILAIVAT